MKKTLSLVLCAFTVVYVFAQNQTDDCEGTTQAAALKKLNKKATFGAYSIQKDLDFGTAKGMDGSPVVTAMEKGNVEMTSIEKNSFVGYVLPYNQFVRLTDYDF